MDPGIIAAIGTIALTVAFKVIQYIASKSKDKPAHRVEIEDNNSEWLCNVWERRHQEEDMVNAGVITVEEMTVCDNLDCENCLPSRPKRQPSGIKLQLPPPGSGGVGYKKPEPRQRMFTIYGKPVPIPIPMGVPDRAHAKVMWNSTSDSHVIEWDWIDTLNGEHRSLKSVYTPQMVVEFMSALDGGGHRMPLMIGEPTKCTRCGCVSSYNVRHSNSLILCASCEKLRGSKKKKHSSGRGICMCEDCEQSGIVYR